MALVKCPRCELNYMQSTEKVCQVCRREMRGDDEHTELELCANCGEHPPLPGEEFCQLCLKEMARGEEAQLAADEETADESVLELPGASEMDEIEVDAGEQTIPQGEYKVIKDELGVRDEEDVLPDDDDIPVDDEDDAISSLEELSELELDDDDDEDDV